MKTDLFAVTEDGNSDKSEKIRTGGEDQLNSFTVYPREKPTQSEKIGWINKWTDGLNGAGYSAFLRKVEPYGFSKLNPSPLLTIPGDADGGRK